MVPCHIPISLANDHVIWATGRGQVLFNPVINKACLETVVLNDVLFVPALQNNLFSILHVVKHSKVRVVIEGETLEFSKGGKTILMATIHGNTGLLDGTTLTTSENAYIAQRIDKDLLHRRLGHIGKDRLNTLLRLKLADGVLTKPNTEVCDICEHCIAGKQHRDPFPKLSEHRSPELLGRIHTDLHGPLPRTFSGYQYWITLTDDFSRFKTVYPLKLKSVMTSSSKGSVLLQ